MEKMTKLTRCWHLELYHKLRNNQIVEVYKNNLYQIVKRDVSTAMNLPMVHLSIKRLDQKAIRDWRHFQQIKNELVGENCEAAELYPSENRLIDTSNQYHLWCFTAPNFVFPFGFNEGRQLTDVPIKGAVQRPWPKGSEPFDLQEQKRNFYHKLEKHGRSNS